MTSLLGRIFKSNRGGDRVDRELEEFRSLMEPPSTFEDGFTWSAFFGALFVAFLMIPAGMYMTLVAGMDPSNSAARWVTAILFIEVARRANKTLKKAEIFVLFFLVGAAMELPFEGVLWKQFFVQSRAAVANGLVSEIPSWYAPTDAIVLAQRTLFDIKWLPAILLAIFTMIIGRLDNAILGYGLFKLTSDIEHLPFPMAPLGAQGILALSEEQDELENRKHDMNHDPQKLSSWRWKVFSFGGAIGLVFGAVYLGLPTVTGALLGKPITIFPIPFVDWTQKTQHFLPAVATGLSFDLGQLVIGMVLPYFAMLGSFVGLVITFVANPVLYHFGILNSWTTGDGTVATMFKNNVDFYFSFGIGISLAIAVAGMVKLFRDRGRGSGKRLRGGITEEVAKKRGDISFKAVILVYVVSTITYIVVSGWLIDWHRGVLIVMIFYGFVYTPLISYVTARMEGIAGQVVAIPMIREASFILSGYQGVAIWFLPIPMHNYGVATVEYRRCELTGTRFWSIWKTQIIFTPIVLVSSLFFANFIWGLAPIPGPQYPFTQKMWEFQAENQCIIYTATMGGYSIFQKAFVPEYLAFGLVLGSAAFGVMSWFAWPMFLIYGIVRGLGQTMPHVIIPQFIGALVGRYYFQKKLGVAWRQYAPVVAAGFGCGSGLITMVGVGITFLMKSAFQLPF